MAVEFVIPAKGDNRIYKDATYIGEANTYSFDFSPWAEDNNTVTGVTWTVDSGNGAISGEALSSNVATALVTTSTVGRTLIKVTATTGTEIYVAYLDILTKEPYNTDDDYGLRE